MSLVTYTLIAAAAAASAAASAPQTPVMRADVAAQRAAIEQRFSAEQALCERRFAVAACVEDVQQRRREALVPVVQLEHELDATERRERAAAQAQRVRERQQAAARDEGQRREQAADGRPARDAILPARPVHARDAATAERMRAQAERTAEAEAARRRAQAEERQLRLRERLAEHEAKEAARTKPLAAPLPPASGASAARRAPVRQP
jgi:hypothetical protein